MAVPSWTPPEAVSRQEQFLLKRLERNRKLFGFLRLHRHELFDEGFQAELASMYRASGAGKDPKPPAMLAMALLLQAYVGASDADAVELTVVDLRWQMVLDCLGSQEPAFSQGTLFDFRERLIAHDMDRRLLERTRELAHRTKGFDAKKLPKTLRIAIDSAPLEGAGRVEDTFNLLGHAARKVVECAAVLLGWTKERVCRDADVPMLLAPSIKAALDVQWSDPAQKAIALERLIDQLDRLESWLVQRLSDEMKRPPLSEHVETLRQLRAQDLEPDPKGGGTRIREGTAPDRRISVEDPEMRHGRKSKTKLFNGYKRHIATDIDEGLVLACAVLPANRPEDEAVPALREDMAEQFVDPDELYIDRGYINSGLVADVLERRGEVICRPWGQPNRGLFTKEDFQMNLRSLTVTCPAGQVRPLVPGQTIEFDRATCAACSLRPRCTSSKGGRLLRLADDELLQERLRRAARTPRGRQRLRERTAIEHRLAHVTRRQGARARYLGQRKNLFDLRRASAVVNLEAIQQRISVAARRDAA
jgi:Transposase DDE domain/Transposase domain (DUF772)